MILPIQYDDVTFAGTIITAHKDGKLLTFDANGNIQKDYKYSIMMPTKSNNYNISIDLNGKYGISDNTNNVLVDNKYTYIEYAFDKYFIVNENEKSGVIDYTGKKVLDCQYDVIQQINGTNMIQAIDSKQNTSYIFNKNMEKVAEVKSAHIFIRENYVKIMSSSQILYFDFDGNIKNASDIYTNNQIFAKEQNGKWGYVDKNGNTVVDFKYDMATDINEYGFGAIKFQNKWGSVDANGKVVKEPTYRLNNIDPTFIGEFYKESAEYEITEYSRNTEIVQ